MNKLTPSDARLQRLVVILVAIAIVFGGYKDFKRGFMAGFYAENTQTSPQQGVETPKAEHLYH